MGDTSLCYLSATEALALFESRELSPVELLEALIARAEQVEPIINALSHRHFEEALQKAKRSETRYMRPNRRRRKLEGLALAVKEDTPVKGKPHTLGSLIFKDRIASETSPSLERLINAGAIVHAQTTCPEFVWPWTCTSRLHGVTRNPWNPAITSGASSGGSAAALASGTTTLATGSDSAGSIRMPAGMCGVVGYKPPYGRNPQSPELSMDMFMHTGPMTRTVADAALMQNVMSGHDVRDHASIRGRIKLNLAPSPIAGMKIAYSLDMATHHLSDEVRNNTLSTLDRLRGLGAETEEVATPWAPELFAKANHWGDLLYSDDFCEALAKHPDLICDYTRTFARENAKTTAHELHDLLQVTGRAWRQFAPVLEHFDVFICPSVAATTIPAEGPDTVASVPIGDRLYSAHDVVMTFYFNAFSRCPVLAVPSGFAGNGVPTGIQIVARTFSDRLVFRVAHALEQTAPFFTRGARHPL